MPRTLAYCQLVQLSACQLPTLTSELAVSMALSRHPSRHPVAQFKIARSKAGNWLVRLSSKRPSSSYLQALRDAILFRRQLSGWAPGTWRDADWHENGTFHTAVVFYNSEPP